ncbi:MAG: TonB-dependent receptor [Proteobacteria bacterium]|nr:TonB-dependent receptor [Pseudomonadota bacterium]
MYTFTYFVLTGAVEYCRVIADVCEADSSTKNGAQQMWILQLTCIGERTSRQFSLIAFALIAAAALSMFWSPTALAQPEPKVPPAQADESPVKADESPAKADESPAESEGPRPTTEVREEIDTPTDEVVATGEVIVVTGTRNTIQSSIQEKRFSDAIVDALSADDIGDIPALSIGEALETLPGAASHREQGGATEISIRGMGPYLGSTVINGREATNGSGDRSVNFSQFPSELFTKLKIYKTQEASLIEGGVSGQISLETLKPLEYGERRFQLDAKGNYHPDNADIDNNARDFGRRITLSYIDQFETNWVGDVGVSIGYQKRLTTNPEQEFRTTSNWRACRVDPTNTEAGVFRSEAGDCDDDSGNLDLVVDRDTGTAPDADVPFIFVPSSRSYRQNITDDDRESVFGALQWRPFDRLDINLDVQLSDRTFTEVRNDLVFAEQRHITPGVTDRTLESSSTGEVALFETLGPIETNSTYQERIEDYRGGGLNVSFRPTDHVRLSIDASYSDTNRRENIVQTRLRSSERLFTSIVIPGAGSRIPLVTVRDFDVNNADLFAAQARTRVDLDQMRENTIAAIRGDVEFKPKWPLVTTILAGVRYSELGFKSFPRARETFDDFDDEVVRAANEACRNKSFPESGFLSDPSGDQALITNTDEAGNVIASGTGSSYATFRPRCLAQELLGRVPQIPEAGPAVGNIDVEEQTFAAYVQANYVGKLFGKRTGGNFGVRLVNTDVDSTGLRTIFTTVENDDDTISVVEDKENFSSVVGGGDYTELLPSVNLVMDLAEVLLVRGAIFRGLSRPDPADLGFGRVLAVDDSEDLRSIDDLVGNARALGNPDLKPLTSWNFDVALEWYPNRDTILASGAYYKRFLGGFENAQRVETFEIDGDPFDADVTTARTDKNASNLMGFELSAAHALTYLPGILRGFGVKVNLNLARSDFEFEDETFGASTEFDDGGSRERVGIVPAANLFGFSNSVLSAQLYYQLAGFDLQVIFKRRSAYFQQFISAPGIIRYVGSNSVLEARATYQITDNFSVRIESINLLDEPRIQYNPTPDNLAEVNSYGPRLFFGLRAKL